MDEYNKTPRMWANELGHRDVSYLLHRFEVLYEARKASVKEFDGAAGDIADFWGRLDGVNEDIPSQLRDCGFQDMEALMSLLLSLGAIKFMEFLTTRTPLLKSACYRLLFELNKSFYSLSFLPSTAHCPIPPLPLSSSPSKFGKSELVAAFLAGDRLMGRGAVRWEKSFTVKGLDATMGREVVLAKLTSNEDKAVQEYSILTRLLRIGVEKKRFFVTVHRFLFDDMVRNPSSGAALKGFAMEVGGDNLESYLASRRPSSSSSSQREMALICFELLQMVHQVHQAGVVWMDVSLSNIVHFPSSDPQWKAVDFDCSLVAGKEVPRAIAPSPRGCHPSVVRYLETSWTSSPLVSRFEMDYWGLANCLLTIATGKGLWERWRVERDLPSDREVMSFILSVDPVIIEGKLVELEETIMGEKDPWAYLKTALGFLKLDMDDCLDFDYIITHLPHPLSKGYDEESS